MKRLVGSRAADFPKLQYWAQPHPSRTKSTKKNTVRKKGPANRFPDTDKSSRFLGVGK